MAVFQNDQNTTRLDIKNGENGNKNNSSPVCAWAKAEDGN